MRTSDLTYKNNSRIPRLQVVKQLVTPIPHTEIRLQIAKSLMNFGTILHKILDLSKNLKQKKNSENKKVRKRRRKLHT
jgi:hypothetical protein